MKKILFLLACLFLLAANSQKTYAQSCPKWGPYAGAHGMEGNADLMMADVMTPSEGLAPFTYSCVIQFSLGSSGGYCGLQDGDGSDSVRPFNNIFSVWDYPNKVQLTYTYKDPMTFVGGFGNEGTGLHSHCDFGWKPNQWYTNVVRRWYDGGDKTYVAYFIYDQTKKEWRHYVTFAVPEANAMLHGNISSFLENFADDSKRSRTAYYKSYWKLTTEGKWVKPDTLDANAGEGNWKCASLGNDGVSLTSCGKEMINGVKGSFPVHTEANSPAILKVGEIYDVAGYYNKQEKKVYVDWSIKTSGAPQLSYVVELYDTNAPNAKPLATASGFGPEIRGAVLTLNTLSVEKKDYYVVLKVKDIFNQDVEPKQFVLSELKP